MIIGIVGSEAAKFTPRTEAKARRAIQQVIAFNKATLVVSGGCHLGGIDIWSIEIAESLGVETKVHYPKRRSWEGGYKQRNMLIGRSADLLVCVTVKVLPEGYRGMRFNSCYHCGTPPEHHVKSGGCWTMKFAAGLDKQTQLIVIE